MKIAIIGPGNIAGTHVQELQGMGYQPVLIVGRDPERTRAFAEAHGIPEYSVRFEDVLADGIDAVHVCTPPTLHYEMVRQLITAGKHVICEKPLCLTAGEARDLMELAKEKGVVTAVNFNVRYHDACIRMSERIRGGELGQILVLHGGYEQEFHVLPAEYSWRYQEPLAGPMRATTEIGSHWIDLARYLTGLEIEAVSASYGAFQPERVEKDGTMYRADAFEGAELPEGARAVEVKTDDIVSATLRFSNGAIGALYLSEITQGRSNYVNIEITGTEKTMRWNSEAPYRIESAVKFGGTLAETNAFGGGFPDTFSAFFRQVYRDLESGVPSGHPAYPTFEDGCRNAAVCEAIYESANTESKWTEVK